LFFPGFLNHHITFSYARGQRRMLMFTRIHFLCRDPLLCLTVNFRFFSGCAQFPHTSHDNFLLGLRPRLLPPFWGKVANGRLIFFSWCCSGCVHLFVSPFLVFFGRLNLLQRLCLSGNLLFKPLRFFRLFFNFF